MKNASLRRSSVQQTSKQACTALLRQDESCAHDTSRRVKYDSKMALRHNLKTDRLQSHAKGKGQEHLGKSLLGGEPQ